MAPETKKAAKKRPRESYPKPEQVEFTIPEHQAWFTRLYKLKFSQTWFPDLSELREILLGDDMADDVKELISGGSWWRLLFIREPAIRMLTLEVLSSFEFDRSYNCFSNINTI